MSKNISKEKITFDKLKNIFGFGKTAGHHSGLSQSLPQSLSQSQVLAAANRPRECQLSNEQKNDIGKKTPISVRLKALKELEEIVENKRLVDHATEHLIFETIDLLDEDKPAEVRHAIWRFYKSLVRGQSEKLFDLRYKFLQLVKIHSIHDEDIPWRLDLMFALTDDGKNIEYCQNEIGVFMVNWFDKIITVSKLTDFLKLLTNLIKYNASCFEQDVISDIIKKIYFKLDIIKTKDDFEPLCHLFDVIVCYSLVPKQSLTMFLVVLCKGISFIGYQKDNFKPISEFCCKIVKNLMGTKLGHSCVACLCHILQDETNHQDIPLMKASVHILAQSFWGCKKIHGLKQTPNSILPAFKKALECKNRHVGIEVAESLYTLIQQQSKDLSMLTWSIILQILDIFIHNYNMSKSSKSSDEVGNRVHLILDFIEDLIQNNEFYGDKEKFYYVIEMCSAYRTEKSVLGLINYRSSLLNQKDKKEILKWLIKNYNDEKVKDKQMIRLKVLDVLNNVMQNQEYSNEEGIIDLIILPTFNIQYFAKETDIKCREKVVQMLVKLDFNSLGVKKGLEIFETLESVCNKIFESKTEETNIDDIRSIIPGLITIFQSKFLTSTALYSVQAFKLLSNYLNSFYSLNELSYGYSSLKIEIFQFLLTFRANSFGQITTKSTIRNGFFIYSPFVVCTRNELSPSSNLSFHSQIGLSSPPPSPRQNQSTQTITTTTCYSISFLDLIKSIINCLKFERDWNVLKFVLNELSEFLKNKAIILHENSKFAGEICISLCDLFDRSKNMQDFICQDAKVSKTDIQFSVFPALLALVSYKDILDCAQKTTLIKSLQNGLVLVPGKVSNTAQCILALTICSLEMQDVMVKCLPEILLKISKISATVALAIPKLEFLSNLILLPNLYQNFTLDQYMTVFAIALGYTHSNKFHEYTVTLAHRVIAMWFLKCRQRFRQTIVQYIIKGLQNNLMQDNYQMNEIQRNRSSSLNTETATHHKKLEARYSSATSPPPNTPNSSNTFSFSNEAINQHNTAITHATHDIQNSKSELIETCMDLLASYTFGMCSNVPQKSTLFERIFDRPRSETWLIGHKLITVTTSNCTSRASNNGLCEKCNEICKSTNVNSTSSNVNSTSSDINSTSSNMNSTSSNVNSTSNVTIHSDSDNDFSYSSEIDKINRRRHQSEFHSNRPTTSKPISNAFDDSFIKSHNISQSKTNSNALCCCWCQNWAEISIRRSTGVTSWIFKLQNTFGMTPQYFSTPSDDLPNLAKLFSAETPNDQPNDRSLNPVQEIYHKETEIQFIPIPNAKTETDRASSTPPTFKRTSSSPEIEPLDTFQTIHIQPKVIHTVNTVVNTDMINQKSSISRAQSFGSKKQSVTPRSTSFKSSSGKSKLNLSLNQDNTNTSSNINTNTSSNINQVNSFNMRIRSSDASLIDQQSNFRDRAYTISGTAQDYRKAKFHEMNYAPQKSIGLTPRFVFLQLYYNSIFDEKVPDFKDKDIRENRTPILLPKNDAIERGLRNLDLITPYETHKIGIVYVGAGQTDDKNKILSNRFGSTRYIEFLKGMGTFIKLEDVDLLTNYVGGLDTKGNDGKYALSWQDTLTQVIFHVATLMPVKPNDPDCNEKKRHIGNDHVCIVYNDSGEKFNLATIKGEGQFIQVVIVIEPYEYNSNLVVVQTKEDFSELIGHFESQILSDSCLPIYVRQLALHANLGAMVNINKFKQGAQHISNWVERLKQIKRIKERVLNAKDGSKMKSNENDGNQSTGDIKSQYVFPDFNDFA